MSNTKTNTNMNNHTTNDARQILKQRNITIHYKIASTIQGSVYKGILNQNNNKKEVIIKRVNKRLSNKKLAKLKSISDNTMYHVGVNEELLQCILSVYYIYTMYMHTYMYTCKHNK